MTNLKGWKTLGFNLLLVVGPPALAYLASVNWTDYLSPTWAPVIVGGIGIVLRMVTTTPVGKGTSNVEFTPTGRKLVIGFLIVSAALFGVSSVRAADIPLPLPKPAAANAAPTPACAIAFCTGPYAGGGLDGNGTSADIIGSGLNGSVFGAGAIPSIDAGYQYWNGSILFDGEAGIGYAMPSRNSVNGLNASPGQTGWLAYQEFQVGGQLSGLLGQNSQPVTVPTALAPYLIAPYAAIGVAEQQGGSTGMDVGAGLKFAFSPNLLLDLGYRHYSLTTVSGPVVTKDDNLIRLRLNYVFK